MRVVAEILVGVYKISSNNGKCYIGSSINIKKRWREHRYYLNKNIHHSKKLQNYFNKYGIETLSFDIIELCDRKDLQKLEQFYIDLYKPFFNSFLTAVINFGHKKDDKCKELISKKLKGRVLSEEQKIHLSNYFSIPLLQYSREGIFIREFKSAKEASIILNTSDRHISECCKFLRKTCKNFVWRYKTNYEIDKQITFTPLTYPRTPEEANKVSHKSQFKPVIQYSKQNEYINEFESIKQASIITKTNPLSISRCCKGNKYKTAGGYIWKFKN